MVNLRSPPVRWKDSEFQIEIDPQRSFYFVGDAPEVVLRVTNKSTLPFDEMVTVVWRLSGERAGQTTVNGQGVHVQLGPSEPKRIQLREQWLPFPGYVDYEIYFTALPADPAHGDPMASYTVFDRGPFEREEGWRLRGDKLQQRTFYSFIASAVATVVLTGLVIYLTFKPALGWP